MTIRLGHCYNKGPNQSLVDFTTRTGGVNRFGRPMYRLVWSDSRLNWAVGEHHDFDAGHNVLRAVLERRMVPKYPLIKERWILESWKPAAAYGTEDQWVEANTSLERGEFVSICGPYPREGDYEICFVFQDTEGGYIEPTPTLIEGRIQEHRRFVENAYALARAMTEAREAKKKGDKNFYSDVFGEAFAGFLGRPYVSLAGLEVPTV